MPDSILTALQRDVLRVLVDAGCFQRGFYFTGGTALAEFYLHHRYSDDLDIFTRVDGGVKSFLNEFERVVVHSGFEFEVGSRGDFARYYVYQPLLPDGKLKVEFAHAQGIAAAAPTDHDGVLVESFEDIAINKIDAIFGREPSELKDYIDLYFILNESRFTLDYLISGAAEKRNRDLETDEGVLYFAARLREAGRLELRHRTVEAVSLDTISNFFEQKAEEIILRYRPRRY